MSDTNSLVGAAYRLAISAIVALAVCAPLYSFGVVYLEHHTLVELVDKGVDPVTAKCLASGWETSAPCLQAYANALTAAPSSPPTSAKP